jgi:hypothetical protein
MATKPEEILNPRSCWNKAAEDEPLFVLRANDANAPQTVMTWANLYVESKGGWNKMLPHQREKFNEALRCAQRMRDWHMQFSEDIPF